jgi:hypothetical protein
MFNDGDRKDSIGPWAESICLPREASDFVTLVWDEKRKFQVLGVTYSTDIQEEV